MTYFYLLLFFAGALIAPVLAFRLVGRGRRPWLALPALGTYFLGAYLSRFVLKGPWAPTLGGVLAVVLMGLATYRRLGHPSLRSAGGASGGAAQSGTRCPVCGHAIVVEAAGVRCQSCPAVCHRDCLDDHLCRGV